MPRVVDDGFDANVRPVAVDGEGGDLVGVGGTVDHPPPERRRPNARGAGK